MTSNMSGIAGEGVRDKQQQHFPIPQVADQRGDHW